jgi:hypothetical protein
MDITGVDMAASPSESTLSFCYVPPPDEPRWAGVRIYRVERQFVQRLTRKRWRDKNKQARLSKEVVELLYDSQP